MPASREGPAKEIGYVRSGGVLRTACLLTTMGAFGCGGSVRIEPRFVAVHNVMTAVGFAQVGPISEATLREGASIRVPVDLAPSECRTFVALGDGRIDDVDVLLVTEDGEVVAHDESVDRQAAVDVCDPEGGHYELVVTAVDGRGGVLVTSYATAGGAGGMGRGGRPNGIVGGCDGTPSIAIGQVMEGDTSLGANRTQGSCVEGIAPEVNYRLTIEQTSQVIVSLESGYDGAVYILRTCGNTNTEIACNDDFERDTSRSRVSATLEPGNYTVVVDGYGEGAGPFRLLVETRPVEPLNVVCGAAPALQPGVEVTGTTADAADRFQATCAGGARSPDAVYRLDVAERSRVRVRQRSEHDGALYLRQSCEEATSELMCNDDAGSTHTSVITGVFDPGTYYVVTDGFSGGGQSHGGQYALTAELAPLAGGGAQGDACGGATDVTVGETVEADTFAAADDGAGSCGGGGGADVFYRLRTTARSRIEVRVTAPEFSGAVYLRRGCDANAAELACVPFTFAEGSPGQAVLSAEVDAGQYVLVLDGASADQLGRANLSVRVVDLVAMNRMCERGPLLRAGATVNGSTAGQPDSFQASCAGGARSGDAVYRIRLTRRQYVRVEMSTTDFDGALHIRRECAVDTSEIACNDDAGDQRHSVVEANLDPGTYYVVVDGFDVENTGSFSLRYETGEPRNLAPSEAPEPGPRPGGPGGPGPRQWIDKGQGASIVLEKRPWASLAGDRRRR